MNEALGLIPTQARGQRWGGKLVTENSLGELPQLRTILTLRQTEFETDTLCKWGLHQGEEVIHPHVDKRSSSEHE